MGHRSHPHSLAGERGQASVEWVALLALAALIVLLLLAIAGTRIPGADLAKAIVSRITCALSLSDSCSSVPELVSQYGEELAGLVREHAPDLVYEEGMRAVPVDFRSCRKPQCADGPTSGIVSRTSSGEPIAAFVHVIDCRAGTARRGESAGYDCSGPQAGSVYLQYWFYYADSATARGVIGDRGYHEDDWESLQVRISADGAFARASSHHGYNYEFGAGNWASDAGWGPVREATETVGVRPEGGWGPSTGTLFVSGGSHAGNAKRDGYHPGRATPGSRLSLIPIEPLAHDEGDTAFAVTPPWLKPVYTDPESEET